MDYSNGKIYAIYNTEDDECYVGSTTQTLTKRLSWHKTTCNNPKNHNRLIVKHFHKVGIEKFYIKLIKDFSCENKSQLTAEESKHIKEIGTLNMIIPHRTREEYLKDKPEMQEYLDNWRFENREKYLECLRVSNEKRRESHLDKMREKVECECGRFVNVSSLKRHKRNSWHIRAIENKSQK